MTQNKMRVKHPAVVDNNFFILAGADSWTKEFNS